MMRLLTRWMAVTFVAAVMLFPILGYLAPTELDVDSPVAGINGVKIWCIAGLMGVLWIRRGNPNP